MNARGLEALALTLPFDEMQLLRDNAAYVKHALGLKRVDIYGPSDAVRYAVHSVFFPVSLLLLWVLFDIVSEYKTTELTAVVRCRVLPRRTRAIAAAPQPRASRPSICTTTRAPLLMPPQHKRMGCSVSLC